MIVYKITHKLSGKCYIGCTKNSLVLRWQQHRAKESCCRSLYEAIQKYGKIAFSLDVLGEYKTRLEAYEAEEYYIGFHNCIHPNGYNLLSGGLTRKPSKETIDILRKIAITSPGSGRYKKGQNKGMATWNKGIKMSAEHKRKMLESRKKFYENKKSE